VSTARLGGVKPTGDQTGLGSGGRAYGDRELNHWYLGSGGGSGGNAKDMTTNPKGEILSLHLFTLT